MSYLTDRQKEVLDFIKRSIKERGVAPTLSEIAEEFSFSSTASGQKHLIALERKGYIRRFYNQKRGIVVVGKDAKHLEAVASFDARGDICLSSISEKDVHPVFKYITGWTIKPVTITWEV